MPEKRLNVSGSDVPPDPDRAYFGSVRYDPGGTFGPRYQPKVQLVLVTTGSARIKVDAGVHLVPAGQAICMHPGHHEHYQFDRREPTEHTWVDLWWDAVPAEVVKLLGPQRAAITTPEALSTMVQTGLALQRDVARQRSALNKLAMACLLTFLSGVEAVDGVPSGAAAVPEPVRKALTLVEDRLDQPLSNDDLAEAAGVCRAHLIRLFGMHVGETPMRHLWRRRVQRGVDLLVGTGLSVSEIAYRVGFASPHHFARLVRQQTGRTPRAVRQSGWQRTGP